jgi:FKBP-type peptidyl-prolyl cis-trans isomerase 2
MKEGDEKEITLKPEEAYGSPNPEYVQEVPKDKFPEGAKVGMQIGVPTPMGQIPAMIEKVDEKTVTINMNHPLAGKTLNFKLKVRQVTKGDFTPKEPTSCCGGHEEEGHSCSC